MSVLELDMGCCQFKKDRGGIGGCMANTLIAGGKQMHIFVHTETTVAFF